MANKEAVFTVKVNTGNSVQDLQNADKAVQQLGQDLQKTQQTAKDNSGTDSLSKRLAELDARLEAGGLSMREMTKTMKEYQTIALQAGVGTPIGDQALRNASALKDEIGDLKSQTTALSSDFVKLDTATAGIEVGAQAFMGFQSAMALAGAENEDMVKTMVKLQAVQGLTNSITTIANKLNSDSILGIQVRNGLTKLQTLLFGQNATATTAQTTATVGLAGAQNTVTVATNSSVVAMKALKVALATTGILAVVAGVGYLLGAFDSLVSSSQRVSEAEKTRAQIQANANEIQQTAIENSAKELSALDSLSKTINDESLTRKEKNKAIKDLQTQYPDLLKNVKGEKLSIEELNQVIALNIKLSESRARVSAGEALRAKKYQDILQDEMKLNDLRNVQSQILLYNKRREAGISDEQQDRLFAEIQANKTLSNSYLGIQDAVFGNGKALQDLINQSQKSINSTKQEIKAIDGITQADKKLIEQTESKHKVYESDIEAEKKAIDAKKKANEDAVSKRKKQLEDEANATQQAHKKSQEDLKKHNKQLLDEEEARDEAIRRSKMSARDLELSDIQDEYFAKRTQAEQLGAEGAELVAKLTAEEETKKAEVRKKYADAELEALANRETKRRERQKFLDEINLTDQEKALQDINAKFEESKNELLRRLNSTNEDERITQEEFNKTMVALEQKKADKILEINKETSEKSKAQQQKDREESLKGVTDFLANSQMVLDHVKTVNNLINEIDQARLNKLNETRDEDLANLDAKMQQELNVEGTTAEQKKQIEEKFAQQKYQVQLQAFNAEEKIRKQQFIRDKAIKLSQIAIDTASAIVKAIAQYGPPPSPMGIAGIASASIIGITQALAVANQQYKSGSAPSAPNISTGGGAMTGASASSFSSAPTATTSTAGLTEQGTPTPTTTSTQVYVLESDISATQNKVKLQEAKTSF